MHYVLHGANAVMWRANEMKKIVNTNLAVSTSQRGFIPLLFSLAMLVTTSDASAQQNIDPDEMQTRILVYSAARVEVRTELYARILEIPFGEGLNFAKGDILIRFDCARYDAERKAARASANAANIEHRTKRKLLKFQAVGKDEVKLAAAQSAKAHAELKVHQVRAQQCQYEAPFAGRIVEKHVNTHEFSGADKPLLTILNDSALELQLVVPSTWFRWMKSGQKFNFVLDETGETHSGVITRIGAQVDPVSQTIKVIAGFQNAPGKVLAGMSGTAIFAAGS